MLQQYSRVIRVSRKRPVPKASKGGWRDTHKNHKCPKIRCFLFLRSSAGLLE